VFAVRLTSAITTEVKSNLAGSFHDEVHVVGRVTFRIDMVFVAENNAVSVTNVSRIFLPVVLFQILAGFAQITFSLPSIFNEFLEGLGKGGFALVHLEHDPPVKSTVTVQTVTQAFQVVHIAVFGLTVKIRQVVLRLGFVLKHEGQNVFLLGRLGEELERTLPLAIHDRNPLLYRLSSFR